jgi:UDP-N-acetylmuramate dehydrogenase
MSAAVGAEMVQTTTLLTNEPMADHTSWRVGGPADLFFTPESLEELQAFLADLPDETVVHWLGLGSNVLVRDGGIRGAVISTSRLPRLLEQVDDVRVLASAGVPCNTLARRCARWRLGPAAFFAGIPGTVGGALAMNAGAFDGETWDRVERVATIDRHGRLHERPRDEFEISYRTVVGAAGQWFVSALFAFEPGAEDRTSEISALLKRRGATQPVGKPSAGSVFRNPQGDHAGRLIEAAGLKGARVGGAVVSDKHANFIINTGDASADDIERLIEHVRATVLQASGVELELEVRVIGNERGAER